MVTKNRQATLKINRSMGFHAPAVFAVGTDIAEWFIGKPKAGSACAFLPLINIFCLFFPVRYTPNRFGSEGLTGSMRRWELFHNEGPTVRYAAACFYFAGAAFG